MCSCNKIGKRRKKMAKKRKSTTRRRSASVRGLNTKDAGGLIMNGVLPGAVGAIVIKKILDMVLPAEYAQYSNYAVAAAGIGTAIALKNPMAKAAGLGAATVAASNIVQDLVDGQGVSGLGLLAPGIPSARIAANGGQMITPRYSPFSSPGVIQQ